MSTLRRNLIGAKNAPMNGMDLPVDVATLRVSASSTENVPYNDNVRVYADDGKHYTLRAWNAMFVESGYSRVGMPTPLGFSMVCGGERFIYYFSRSVKQVYNIVGLAQVSAGQLQHSPYDVSVPTSTSNGNDSVMTSKVGDLSVAGNAKSDAWSFTKGESTTTLVASNTGAQFTYDNVALSNNLFVQNNHNSLNICKGIKAYTEWLRHRFAISSGIAVPAGTEDGDVEDVDILNASGEQAAVGEDMYFWIGGVNSGLKAKYNLNNNHGGSAYLTQAIADAIYDSQVAVGINMNDTGVNSEAKPVLAEGSKGAEAIAVDGYWMIVTPYVSNCSATIATATNNMADAPAVYWSLQHGDGHSLPSEYAMEAIWMNKSRLVTPLWSYLTSKEGWSLTSVPAEYVWCASRVGSTGAIYVSTTYGFAGSSSVYYRYAVVAVSAF